MQFIEAIYASVNGWLNCMMFWMTFTLVTFKFARCDPG